MRQGRALGTCAGGEHSTCLPISDCSAHMTDCRTAKLWGAPYLLLHTGSCVVTAANNKRDRLRRKRPHSTHVMFTRRQKPAASCKEIYRSRRPSYTRGDETCHSWGRSGALWGTTPWCAARPCRGPCVHLEEVAGRLRTV